MPDTTLSSGAEMHVTPAPFKDAEALLSAIMEALKGAAMPQGTDLTQMDVSVLKDMVLGIGTSGAVKAALWKCLERTTWNKMRVVPDLFDTKPEARKDYFEMAKVAIQENCGPFFENALSMWKGLKKTEGDTPKQG